MKKELERKYYSTEEGKVLKSRLTRILIYSILLIGIGIVLLIEACINKDSTAEYIYSIILIVIGIIFLISRYILKKTNINAYIENNGKKEVK